MIRFRVTLPLKLLAPIVLTIFTNACTTVAPLEEYTLARTALESAREQDAARYAPSYWHRAEEFFRMGESQFKNEEYEKAEERFRESRNFSEKAENVARLQKFKSGEVFP